jgi:hypothetical protein
MIPHFGRHLPQISFPSFRFRKGTDMKRRSVVAFVLGALAINSCGFSPEGGKDARQEKLDDGFQKQIQKWAVLQKLSERV